MLISLPSLLIAFFCLAPPSDRELVVSVVQESGTNDILISVENVTSADQSYFDSFSGDREIPKFISCQFAVRNNKGEISHVSREESFDTKSSDAVLLPATLSKLKSGQKVTKSIPRDRLRDIVEDMIISDKQDHKFNTIRFMVRIARDSSLSVWVSGHSEYLELADYRTDGHK